MNDQLPMTTPAITVLPARGTPMLLACLLFLSSFIHAAPWALKLPEKLAAEWQKTRALKDAAEAVKLVEQRLAALAAAVPKIETSLAANGVIVPGSEVLPQGRGEHAKERQYSLLAE